MRSAHVQKARCNCREIRRGWPKRGISGWIAVRISWVKLGELVGVDNKTAKKWISEKSNELENSEPPENRQHFDGNRHKRPTSPSRVRATIEMRTVGIDH